MKSVKHIVIYDTQYEIDYKLRESSIDIRRFQVNYLLQEILYKVFFVHKVKNKLKRSI